MPPCRHTQEFTACDLKISAGSSIYVVATTIHEQCGLRLQKLLLLYLCLWICAHSVNCVLPVSMEIGCIWLLPQCLSLSRISPDAPAGTVCKHLSLGSFLYLDPNFVYQLRWILLLICISKGETGSSSQLLFTLCALCVHLCARECIWRTGFPKASKI